MKTLFGMFLVFMLALPAHAQRPEGHPSMVHSAEHERPKPAEPSKTPVAEKVSEEPIVTRHSILVGGKILKYTATVAQMPINNDGGETEGHIFYLAYTLDGVADRAKRPVTFAFNGGPGSSSIWVHMGAMGPRRVKLLDNGVVGQSEIMGGKLTRSIQSPISRTVAAALIAVNRRPQTQ